jgi:hypothetical protein
MVSELRWMIFEQFAQHELVVIYIFLADVCGQPLTSSMVVSGQIFVEDSWAVVTVCRQSIFTPTE